MTENALPIEYHLEIYSRSFSADPFFSAKTSRPFANIAVGDQFDHRGFSDYPVKVAAGSVCKVAEIRHIIWTIEGFHVGHKIMMILDVEPYDRP